MKSGAGSLPDDESRSTTAVAGGLGSLLASPALLDAAHRFAWPAAVVMGEPSQLAELASQPRKTKLAYVEANERQRKAAKELSTQAGARQMRPFDPGKGKKELAAYVGASGPLLVVAGDHRSLDQNIDLLQGLVRRRPRWLGLFRLDRKAANASGVDVPELIDRLGEVTVALAAPAVLEKRQIGSALRTPLSRDELAALLVGFAPAQASDEIVLIAVPTAYALRLVALANPPAKPTLLNRAKAVGRSVGATLFKRREAAAQRQRDAEMAGRREMLGLAAHLYAQTVQSARQQRDLETKLKATEAALEAQAAATGRQLKQVAERISTRAGQTRDQLGRRIERLAAAIGRVQEAMPRAQAAEAMAAARSMFQPLAEEVKSLQAAVQEDRRRNLSLDIAAVMIATRHSDAVVARASALKRFSREAGHQFLMRLIAGDAGAGQNLAGRHLVEVGTTRLRIPGRGSTDQLALFSTLMGLSFTTIDTDPETARTAEEMLPLLSRGGRAVTGKGEIQLAQLDPPAHYVYMDAFDYPYESPLARPDAPRTHLVSPLNDAACWHMNAIAAQSIAGTMPIGGIVVFDDTWTEVDSETDEIGGKGKLAVPYLLARGFVEIGRTVNAVALRRLE